MPDYSLAKIYKIVCNTTGLIYVGSTCEPTLARRLANHRRNLNHWEKNGKGCYITSYKVLENSNYDIVLIENYPCNSKDDLHKRERHYIENINCVNKVIPKRTRKEYVEQYYENNKEKIAQYKKEYYNKKEKYLCTCGKTLTQCNKIKHEKTKKHQDYVNSQNEN
jgi:hypothetical protein